MKASNRDFASRAASMRATCRVYFLCGPDEAGASAAASKLIAGLPEAGDRLDLSGAQLRSDPVRLADEARSTSLFGDRRHIYVRANGEDAHDALATFCTLSDRGETALAWPIIVVATGATDKSRSAKLLADRQDALVGMFYAPKPEHVAGEVRTMAGAAGIRGFDGALADRVARATCYDVRLAQAEIDKLALYLDATPHGPKLADAAALDAIGAASEDDSFGPLVNAVLAGNLKQLPTELARMQAFALNPVGVVLALERRAAQLAALAPRVRPGPDLASQLEREGVYRNDRDIMARLLDAWRLPKLERLIPRLANLHRALISNSQMADLLLAHELAEIARFAALRR